MESNCFSTKGLLQEQGVATIYRNDPVIDVFGLSASITLYEPLESQGDIIFCKIINCNLSSERAKVTIIIMKGAKTAAWTHRSSIKLTDSTMP